MNRCIQNLPHRYFALVTLMHATPGHATGHMHALQDSTLNSFYLLPDCHVHHLTTISLYLTICNDFSNVRHHKLPLLDVLQSTYSPAQFGSSPIQFHVLFHPVGHDVSILLESNVKIPAHRSMCTDPLGHRARAQARAHTHTHTLVQEPNDKTTVT